MDQVRALLECKLICPSVMWTFCSFSEHVILLSCIKLWVEWTFPYLRKQSIWILYVNGSQTVWDSENCWQILRRKGLELRGYSDGTATIMALLASSSIKTYVELWNLPEVLDSCSPLPNAAVGSNLQSPLSVYNQNFRAWSFQNQKWATIAQFPLGKWFPFWDHSL